MSTINWDFKKMVIKINVNRIVIERGILELEPISMRKWYIHSLNRNKTVILK